MIARPAASAPAFDASLLLRALRDAVVKLNPAKLVRNPVIFVTEIVAAVVTFIAIRDGLAGQPFAFNAQLAAWLWFTVLFATFAEAVAEGRGRAQADALRKLRSDVTAKLLTLPDRRELVSMRPAEELLEGDVVLVAGKGHEDYQIVGSERRAFSDREFIRAAYRGSLSPPAASSPARVH